MREIFAFDSPIIRVLIRMTDLVILNMLFILTSIPLVTIGASLTSLNTSWQRILHGKDQQIIWNYFRIFKENFSKSTILSFGIVFLGIVFWLDFQLIIQHTGFVKLGGLFILTPFITTWMIVTLISFVYVGRYEDSIKQCLKNSILLALENPIHTLLLICINSVIFYLTISSPGRLMIAIYFYTFGGISFISLLNNSIIKRIFDKVEKKNQN